MSLLSSFTSPPERRKESSEYDGPPLLPEVGATALAISLRGKKSGWELFTVIQGIPGARSELERREADAGLRAAGVLGRGAASTQVESRQPVATETVPDDSSALGEWGYNEDGLLISALSEKAAAAAAPASERLEELANG